MPFAVNRDPEGFFVLRSRLKGKSVRATNYFVRALLPLPTHQWVAAPPEWSRKWGSRHFGARNWLLQEESPTSMAPALCRGICSHSLQLHGEDKVHTGDSGLLAPGQRVLLASESRAAPSAPVPGHSNCPQDLAPSGAPTQPWWLLHGPQPEGCPEKAEEPGSPRLPLLFHAVLGLSERGAMAWHEPSCTGLFQRSCSLPQTFFSPHGRDETLMQEDAMRELPLWEREPSLLLPGSCNYSLEVGEATGLGPEKEPCCFRHFVRAAVRFSYYSCIEPCVWSSVLWKLPEKDITHVKSQTKWTHFGIYECPLFQRGPFLAAASTSPSTSSGRWWTLVLLEWALPKFSDKGVTKKKIAKGSTASNQGQSWCFNNELALSITL